MAEDIVDVLIIGAGASGAAVAWSLADTRMRIMCIEQGDWLNPAEYASTKCNWEVLQQTGFSNSPNVRKVLWQHGQPLCVLRGPAGSAQHGGAGCDTD